MEATYKIFTGRGDRVVCTEDIPALIAKREIKPDTRIFNNETKNWIDFKDYKRLHMILKTLPEMQSEESYEVFLDGKEQSLTIYQIDKHLKEGKIKPDTKIYNKENGAWISFKEYHNLYKALFTFNLTKTNRKEERKEDKRQVDSEYLHECPQCHHSYSKRAERCPKCGSAVKVTCNICKAKILKSSISCPECGDPEPFTTIKEQAAKAWEVRSDNRNNEALPKSPEAHQKIAALSPLQVLFSFQGRITRQQFWLYCIPTQSIGFIWYIFLELIKESNRQALYGGTGPSSAAAILLLLSVVPICWTSLAINVKRLHDRDKSFMWIFLYMIPFIGTIWWIVELGFLRGTDGRNQYGEDPLGLSFQASSSQETPQGATIASTIGSKSMSTENPNGPDYRPESETQYASHAKDEVIKLAGDTGDTNGSKIYFTPSNNRHLGEYVFSGFALTVMLIPVAIALLCIGLLIMLILGE